jgi:hypothetical protein
VSVTSELVDRLGRHYIKPGPAAGGIFVPEVGLNNGRSERRCDAIYVGFTSTSGRLLIGHEVKVSRSDWLHELDQPEKSARWADQCHGWYIVAPSTDVVPVEELPHGWGLMIPDPRAKVRMKIVHKAKIKENHDPSWLIVRSIMARLDTLQRNQIEQWKRDEAQRVRSEVAAQLLQRQHEKDPQSARDARILDELGTLLGVDLRGNNWDLRVNPVSSVAIRGTRFTKVRDPYYGGAYGQTYHAAKYRCDVCGREGYADKNGRPYEWAAACRRGHAPCDYCGRMLTLKLDGQPRVHTRCPERDER